MPAYLIADIEVTDATVYERYRQQAPAVIAAHGGRYLARGGATEVLEGSWRPARTVILEFPSMAALKSFWSSPEYTRLRKLRESATRVSNLVAIDGLPASAAPP